MRRFLSKKNLQKLKAVVRGKNSLPAPAVIGGINVCGPETKYGMVRCFPFQYIRIFHGNFWKLLVHPLREIKKCVPVLFAGNLILNNFFSRIFWYNRYFLQTSALKWIYFPIPLHYNVNLSPSVHLIHRVISATWFWLISQLDRFSVR